MRIIHNVIQDHAMTKMNQNWSIAHYFVYHSKLYLRTIYLQKNCYNLDQQRLPILDGQREHSILYSCNACAFRENLEEICDKLNTKPEDIDNIFCTLNKFFTLLHCYWGFIQPHKEKYDSLNNHLNFSLSGVGICRCTWV